MFSARFVMQARSTAAASAALHLAGSKALPANSSDQTRRQGAVVGAGVVVVGLAVVGVGVGVRVGVGGGCRGRGGVGVAASVVDGIDVAEESDWRCPS
jgi:hypothetical protein